MGSLSNILSAVQNGVIAVNNLGRQVNGSFNNIAAQIAAITSSYVVSLNTKKGALTFSVVTQVFTSNGTYTPTPGMIYCIIECQAGGGAGGGAAVTAANTQNGGGGAGGGEYARKLATAAAIGASQVVTIGAAGVAATPPSVQTAGGNTSVGTLCIAIGGPAGITAPNSSNGTAVPGGSGGTGDFKVSGGTGSQGFPNNFTSAFPPVGGCGGDSFFGQGGPMISTAQSGLPGSGFGAGGGGASDNGAGNRPGGAGAIGVAIITEFVIA